MRVAASWRQFAKRFALSPAVPPAARARRGHEGTSACGSTPRIPHPAPALVAPAPISSSSRTSASHRLASRPPAGFPLRRACATATLGTWRNRRETGADERQGDHDHDHEPDRRDRRRRRALHPRPDHRRRDQRRTERRGHRHGRRQAHRRRDRHRNRRDRADRDEPHQTRRRPRWPARRHCRYRRQRLEVRRRRRNQDAADLQALGQSPRARSYSARARTSTCPRERPRRPSRPIPLGDPGRRSSGGGAGRSAEPWSRASAPARPPSSPTCLCVFVSRIDVAAGTASVRANGADLVLAVGQPQTPGGGDGRMQDHARCRRRGQGRGLRRRRRRPARPDGAAPGTTVELAEGLSVFVSGVTDAGARIAVNGVETRHSPGRRGLSTPPSATSAAASASRASTAAASPSATSAAERPIRRGGSAEPLPRGPEARASQACTRACKELTDCED